MLSPRSLERKAMVFSPEPKLIELLADDNHRMNTIPMMYPIIPKRQQAPITRGKVVPPGPNDEKQLEACLIQYSGRGISGADVSQDTAYAAGSDHQANHQHLKQENGGGGLGENNGGSSSAKKSSGYGRQPYFCPYAKERMAK